MDCKNEKVTFISDRWDKGIEKREPGYGDLVETLF